MNEEMAPVPKGVGISKVAKFGWTVKDAPGEQKQLSKRILRISPEYQRKLVESKAQMIASSWSWIACGVIIVGQRNGEFWVIDGQHRVMAAKKRIDIDMLQCLVFETESIKQEAQGFLDLNIGRKPVKSIDRFRAAIAAGDEIAIYVNQAFQSFGITPSSQTQGSLHLKSVASALRIAAENKQRFFDVFELIASICEGIPIKERIVEGLVYMHKTWNGFSPRFIKRVHDVGATRLEDGAIRASAYFKTGGYKVWAQGMMDEINKGLHNKFVLDEKPNDKS